MGKERKWKRINEYKVYGDRKNQLSDRTSCMMMTNEPMMVNVSELAIISTHYPKKKTSRARLVTTCEMVIVENILFHLLS
jgi:predicted metalloenzyme YecM